MEKSNLIDHQQPPTWHDPAENFSLEQDDMPENVYPLQYKRIQKEQQKDKQLIKEAGNSDDYTVKSFKAAGKERPLIVKDGKIVIPKPLQKRIVEWYHTMLLHPGETRTELTIKQHFTWTNLRKDVHKICKQCLQCQKHKRHKKKYGHLPPKIAESEPWDKLYVDMIGPYTIPRKGKSTLTLWAVTMIDPATGWFEMKQVNTKRADVIANLVEQTWLSRYPWPTSLIIDRGTEFMAEFAEMIINDYGIKKKPITTRNPQANAIMERIH